MSVVLYAFLADGSTLTSPEYFLLGYSGPILTSIAHPNCSQAEGEQGLQLCPREGGNELVLRGTNLGDSNAVVLVGANPCMYYR